MAILDLLPQEVDFKVARGDTTPFTVTITLAGVAQNITGFTYLLTVDPSIDPADATNNLFQLTGTVTDGPNGIVQFTLTTGQADQTPGTYGCDIQQTDGASAIRTVSRGKWIVQQDVTK